MTDSTWVLSYLTENYCSTIPLIISSKILPKIVSFLKYHFFNSYSIDLLHLQIHSIRIISNISTLDSPEIQVS